MGRRLRVIQWWANPNPDLDLNPDLATFDKSGGFGLDLVFFNPNPVHNCMRVKRADLDLDLKIGLDLDLHIAGFAHHWGDPRTAKVVSLGTSSSTYSRVIPGNC